MLGELLAIKTASMYNQALLARPKLIDLDLDQLYCYPFIISMSICDGSCNTVKDPFGRIYALNKIEDVKLKIFSMIKGINKLIKDSQKTYLM